MNTLRSIMKKVEALTHEVALLKAQNKAPANHQEITSNDVILSIKNVVNLDYVNNLYRK